MFVPPRFDVYPAVSRQVHGVFAEVTDLIQPVALDEAYLDVTENRQGLPTAWQTAKAIRAPTLEGTGLTASAGVFYSKFLTKMASGQRKPNGQFAIQPDEGAAFMEALPGCQVPRRGAEDGREDARPGDHHRAPTQLTALHSACARGRPATQRKRCAVADVAPKPTFH